jgi:hypothetical protein
MHIIVTQRILGISNNETWWYYLARLVPERYAILACGFPGIQEMHTITKRKVRGIDTTTEENPAG